MVITKTVSARGVYDVHAPAIADGHHWIAGCINLHARPPALQCESISKYYASGTCIPPEQRVSIHPPSALRKRLLQFPPVVEFADQPGTKNIWVRRGRQVVDRAGRWRAARHPPEFIRSGGLVHQLLYHWRRYAFLWRSCARCLFRFDSRPRTGHRFTFETFSRLIFQRRRTAQELFCQLEESVLCGPAELSHLT
jgi:hypothetical protein